ncbi:hypothetical protein CANARDRAFT_200084 [[Candida] arabinofermentans NRRL YB-2248]|uniref:Macro-like domain-containing protein n=1 Tax=[Candida] arabinofermentans NRRL YB-2248 TaxID=983967 RepID=A0A1E4SYZ3_9ASCO|nr:hypothetical protein CANARDRAFT_200084 [[Candida] arabinofermentans NRRL YB-2248]
MSRVAQISKFKVILLDLNANLCDCWSSALLEFNNKLNRYSTPIFKYKGQLNYDQLIKNDTCTTTILSPGNSVGYMNGGFDKALARWFSSNSSWEDTETHVQSSLLWKYHGYLSPTNANLVEFNTPEFYKNSKAWNLTNANSILHLPTMRVPRKLFGDAEKHESDALSLEMLRYVYDCTWEILTKYSLINTLILTGIGSGYGGIPEPLVAKAMISAITIYSNSKLSDIDKALYSLKFLKEDFRSLISSDDSSYIDSREFDPLKDPLYKLY